MSQLSVVYVLTNPAMPGFIKIGKTDREDTTIRIAELYTTVHTRPKTVGERRQGSAGIGAGPAYAALRRDC
jgi:hypothetical protein